jgi:hypothetical protein
MKFYDNTESGTIYITTHDAVMVARNALNNGIFQFLFKYKEPVFFFYLESMNDETMALI